MYRELNISILSNSIMSVETKMELVTLTIHIDV